MVAGARSDDTARPLPVRQMRNLVVGAAQLEAEDRLQVLALEKDFVVETLGQAWRLVERRLPRHIVDATGEHVAKKLGEFGGDEHRPIVSGAFGLELSGRRWAEQPLHQISRHQLPHECGGGSHRQWLGVNLDATIPDRLANRTGVRARIDE
jgi:hypothetical protein